MMRSVVRSISVSSEYPDQLHRAYLSGALLIQGLPRSSTARSRIGSDGMTLLRIATVASSRLIGALCELHLRSEHGFPNMATKKGRENPTFLYLEPLPVHPWSTAGETFCLQCKR